MQAELEAHLATEEGPNRKNGGTRKTMKSSAGEFELSTPRDRAGIFEPQIVKKHQTHLTDELERKVIALFALGNSYQDIRTHIADMYDISLSNGTLNAVTDKLLPELQAWRERDLEAIYPIVWLDAIHYKIKENGRYLSKAIYTLLGLNIDGKKELLGLYLSDQEGAHHWLSVLTDLHNRGVKDILIACVDGLKGFPEAIESIYPKTEIQHCIIHQIRNSLKYVVSRPPVRNNRQAIFLPEIFNLDRCSGGNLSHFLNSVSLNCRQRSPNWPVSTGYLPARHGFPRTADLTVHLRG